MRRWKHAQLAAHLDGHWPRGDAPVVLTGVGPGDVSPVGARSRAPTIPEGGGRRSPAFSFATVTTADSGADTPDTSPVPTPTAADRDRRLRAVSAATNATILEDDEDEDEDSDDGGGVEEKRTAA